VQIFRSPSILFGSQKNFTDISHLPPDRDEGSLDPTHPSLEYNSLEGGADKNLTRRFYLYGVT